VDTTQADATKPADDQVDEEAASLEDFGVASAFG
jgi:hypothetical protein